MVQATKRRRLGRIRSAVSTDPYYHIMSALARMIDANHNRAREALRVMEDAARFALNDQTLQQQFKGLRQDLREALAGLPEGWLVANRDTPGDVGTRPGASMTQRDGLLDVVVAAGSRLSEALRVIEEACRTIDPALAGRVEAIRYRAYTSDSHLQLRLGTGRARQWRLCVLLSEALCRRPWRDVVRAVVEAGADCVQVREKHMDGRALDGRVREALQIARPAGVTVIVNDRADVALAAGADGVHLGQDDLGVHDVRRLAGRQLLIGVSTHDLQEASAAIEAGADYCGVGAMFPSGVKPQRQPSGVRYLGEFLAHHPEVPHLAIGGIDDRNARELAAAGARGLAVSTAVCAAEDPGGAVKRLLKALAAGNGE